MIDHMQLNVQDHYPALLLRCLEVAWPARYQPLPSRSLIHAWAVLYRPTASPRSSQCRETPDEGFDARTWTDVIAGAVSQVDQSSVEVTNVMNSCYESCQSIFLTTTSAVLARETTLTTVTSKNSRQTSRAMTMTVIQLLASSSEQPPWGKENTSRSLLKDVSVMQQLKSYLAVMTSILTRYVVYVHQSLVKVFLHYWTREPVFNGYECSSCRFCCYQIFNSLKLFSLHNRS